ncbi:hypothetical protein Cs7R123_09410 [Catellatospora sp. TT07R-123]|uniref:hypothetical protein n=1 Tax=Catellatospora sp. TT07R-123 TaxID=2733863 RepID=UPI001B0FA746|nr:hypothetical protein [Catellatospora sp. TT07R-123]GHJ43599.1 hypothetical protein Cs7R123_09410 [Catellatospora sp. TT07R-123]
MKLHRLISGSLAVAVAAAVGAAAAVAGSATTPTAAHAASTLGSPITRSEVISRAAYWKSTNPVDYDTTMRDKWDQAHSRQYRRDCSGLIDMAWHLNSDPDSVNLGSSGYSVPIAKNKLQPGDILTWGGSGSSGHVVLFVQWAPSYPNFEYYSFGSDNIKYNSASLTSGTIDSHTAVNYSAFRYKNIIDDLGGANLGVLSFLESDSRTSHVNTRPVIAYGNSPMIPIAGDWDGDGIDTPSSYDPSTGRFYISNTPQTGAAQYQFVYGNAYSVPVVGDWDGDGKDNVGVRMGGNFALRTSPVTSATETTAVIVYGNGNDTPIIGDFDGDGRDDVAVYRPSNMTFYLPNATVVYGDPYSVPLVGDWDGDGKDNIGVRMGGTFYFRTGAVTSAIENTESIGYGDGANEVPVIGDWDGNGQDSQAVVV